MSVYICWEWSRDAVPDDCNPKHAIESEDPEFAASEWAEQACILRKEFSDALGEGMHVAVRDPWGCVTHWRVSAELIADFSARAWEGQNDG